MFLTTSNIQLKINSKEKFRHFISLKIVFCFVFFLFLGNNYIAQGGYKKQYYFNNAVTSKCRDVIEAPNGNIVTIGFIVDTLNNNQFNRLTICIADAQGNKLSEKRFGRATFQYLDNGLGSRCPLIKDLNGFYASLVVLDSNNKNLSTLIRFNYNGDTLWQKKYYEPGYDLYAVDIARSIDGGILFTGMAQNLSSEKILILKTDLNGNERWRKKLLSPNGINPAWFGNRIIQDTASKKIIIAGWQYLGTSLCSLILFTDSLGDNPFSQSHFYPLGGSYSDVIQLKNKNFIAVGYLGTNDPYKFKGLVVCFGITGSLIWAHDVDTGSITNNMLTATLLKDGNFIVGGQIDTLYLHNIPPSDKIRLMKMRPDGSTIWKKYYRTLTNANSVGETITSFNSCQDGGFLFSTYFNYKQNPRPYNIYKIDSTGCDSTVQYCQSISGVNEIETAIGNLSIYPNPVNSVINIEGLIYNVATNNYRLKIINVLGKELLNTKAEIINNKMQLSITGLQNGIYFLQLFLEDKLYLTKKIIKD